MTSKYHWNIIFICFIIFLLINWYYLSSFSKKQRFFKTLIDSGIAVNSFNPSIIHFTLNTKFSQSNIVSIIDNNVLIFQIPNLSDTTMILPDGFHHLDIRIFDKIKNIEFYQTIDISTGSQLLSVIVLDKQYKPIRNISVHLELVDYSNINLEQQTNQFGEVSFYNLPKHVQVYIEAICMSTKRHAYVEVNTLHYRNITLVLKEMNAFYDDEYDPSDRGFYAI